jgi:hypothetical protein
LHGHGWRRSSGVPAPPWSRDHDGSRSPPAGGRPGWEPGSRGSTRRRSTRRRAAPRIGPARSPGTSS